MELFVTFLTEAQLQRMHETEGAYFLNRLRRLSLHLGLSLEAYRCLCHFLSASFGTTCTQQFIVHTVSMVLKAVLASSGTGRLACQCWRLRTSTTISQARCTCRLGREAPALSPSGCV